MPVPKPRYSKEEFARRGDEIYDRDISPHVGPNDEGKFVVIDIETGAYEIDQDELAASDRLLARRLDAQIWTRRVGSRYARRFGPHYRRVPTGENEQCAIAYHPLRHGLRDRRAGATSGQDPRDKEGLDAAASQCSGAGWSSQI